MMKSRLLMTKVTRMRRSRGRERSICTASTREALPMRLWRVRSTPIKVKMNPKTRNAGVTIQVRMLM